MSSQKRKDSISIVFILFFISKSFVSISGYIDFNQKCVKTFLCHPNDPSRFLHCVPNLGLVAKDCPPTLLFNTAIDACDWPQNSDCALNVTMNTSPNSVGAATGPTLSSQDSYKLKHFKTIDWDNKKKTSSSKQDRTTTARPTRKSETIIKAKSCDSNICKLPNCKCPDDKIPGSLDQKTIPQIVLLTFDDAVNHYNFRFYEKLLNLNLTNPDGCPIGLTFFVSGIANNFQLVEQLYRQGHGIESHSKTHKLPVQWWSNAGYKELEDEMVGMRNLLAKKSHIPLEKIKGTRIPYLQLGGDNLYQVFKNNNFTWDSSMVARRGQRPIWPFTLEHLVTRSVCQIDICPKGSYPGLWEVPLIQWRDSDGKLYAMPDGNDKPKTKVEMFNFLRENFEVHYKTNRAPFGIFLHATWFNKKQFNLEALQDFLKYLIEMKNVWVIPVDQAIDWVRTPKPMSSLSEIPSWNCKKNT